MNFKQFVEMNHSPVKAYFLVLQYQGNMWSIYLEDALGNKKFLFNKWTPNLTVVEKDLEAWSDSNHYDSFEYRVESGTD